jgi:spermidine/putrescine transport system ATP-binding protein
MLAGMDSPTGGDIRLKGERINDVPANKRPTCMVFQSLALFPHRSVGDNIEFSLKIRGIDRSTRRARALELMQQLRLPEGYYGRSVQKCSGGERQRVALARALAFDPEILFFDEPLSAIDYKLRKTLEKELKDIHRETGKTFVYITHSLEEAMVMSDRIGVMRAGRLVQVGTPHEIYTAPNSRFVSEFMGDVNVLPVRLDGGHALISSAVPADLRAGAIPADFREGFLVIRPEFMRFLASPTEAENVLSGRLYNEYVLGSRIQYQVRVGDHVFVVEKLRQQAFKGQLDEEVLIGWDGRDSILVGP